jgi:hypothetical protein
MTCIGGYYLFWQLELLSNSERFVLRQAWQRSPLFQFAVSCSPHILVQGTAFYTKRFLTVRKAFAHTRAHQI